MVGLQDSSRNVAGDASRGGPSKIFAKCRGLQETCGRCVHLHSGSSRNVGGEVCGVLLKTKNKTCQNIYTYIYIHIHIYIYFFCFGRNFKHKVSKGVSPEKAFNSSCNGLQSMWHELRLLRHQSKLHLS